MANELEKASLLKAQEVLPPKPPGPVGLRSATRWHVAPRLASYGIAIFFAWLLLSMMLPTVFSHSSERAVVDAPVKLVTTPVEGIVTAQQVKVGTPFQAGDTLMTVQNPNVDRSLLADLTGKKLENQQQYDAAKAKLESDQTRLAITNEQLAKYQLAAQKNHAAKVRAIQSRLAVAKAQVDQQEDIVNRNQALQWAGAVSEAYTNASKYQLSILSNSKEAIKAELDNAVNDSQASKGKVFFSAADGSAQTLTQRRDDLVAEIAQLESQLTQTGKSGHSIDDLIAQESERVNRMSNFEIKAYGNGVVEDVLAPPGTRVNAGATLIRSTECSDERVVAVFPRSLSDELLPGAKLKIKVDGVPDPLDASVAEILPRAPDGEQARYLVPFPPIEKTEIYLIAKLDKPLSGLPRKPGEAPSSSCAMGHWAKVSIEKPWWSRLRALL